MKNFIKEKFKLLKMGLLKLGIGNSIKKRKLKFDDFEKKFGGLGTGLVRRTSVRSTYVFQGQVKVNSDDFNEDWFKSLRENIPFYV